METRDSQPEKSDTPSTPPSSEDINRAFDLAFEDDADPYADDFFDQDPDALLHASNNPGSDQSLLSFAVVEGPESFQKKQSSSRFWPEDPPDEPPPPKQPEFDSLEDALMHYFSFPSFREGQKEVIEKVLEGRDVLAIMPTSAGKSLLYQLPSMLLPGLTIVISPLISLMKDQVDKLRERGLPAGFINSSQTDSQNRAEIDAAIDGETKILFVAPERFRSRKFKRQLKNMTVSLFAVDEAHCVSSWGHDFRPDYLKLERAIKLCDRPPVLAVTATATERVRKDIETHLGLREDYFPLLAGFDRPNLFFGASQVATKDDKISSIATLCRRLEGTGIVYCATRKNTVKVGEALNKLGVPAAVYHGGLDSNSRQDVQERFMAGEVRVVCATNAFGLGIDKQDVRFVAHYDLPGSMEAYYQEAGRAGRDAKPSECLFLFRGGDVYIQEFLIETSYPSRALVESVYRQMLTLDTGRKHEITLAELKQRIPDAKSERTISAALRLLEEAGHVMRGGRLDNPANFRQLLEPKKGSRAAAQKLLGKLIKVYGQRFREGFSETLPELAYQTGTGVEALRKHLPALRDGGYISYRAPFSGRSLMVLEPRVPISELRVDYSELEERRRRDMERLQLVINFAFSTRCRRAYILEYFGAPFKENCSNCDVCTPREGTRTARSLTDAELIVLKKLLSCVVRMKGRYGKSKVIQVLRGSRAKDIREHRLDRLSTHGLLNDWSQQSLAQLMNECIGRRLVNETRDDDGRYPKVSITDVGRDVLFDRARVELIMPDSSNAGRAKRSSKKVLQRQVAANSDEEALFQELRRLRMRLSVKRNVKPFMVFPDRTLRAIASARPTSKEQLQTIPGVGPAKIRQFGKIVVDFIQSYEGA